MKIVYILLFLILAGYSCWATEHSFHLLFPNVPELLVWGVTIAFFVVASYGSKLIVDSLNTNVFIDNRKGLFWGGFVLLLIFWLMASMPTNTHTFFYNHKIGDVAIQDLNTTKSYLEQIATKQNTDTAYFILKDEVNKEHILMTDEFNGKGPSHRKGNGENVASHLRKINDLIGCNIPINENWNSHDVAILNNYDNAILRELQRAQSRYQVSNDAVAKAREYIANVNMMDSALNKMVYVGNINEELLKQTEGVLQLSYAHIKNNNQYVRFNSEKDKDTYTAVNLETKIKRMLSVIDVWLDFLGGKYPASFIFYVLISILVDVAAFIFFDLAFKKQTSL